jgi:ABC-type transport system involved in multi-copper enzyme maturation permease subunit
MLFLIIRKEILEHLLSLRFAISCIVCFVVILSSVFVLTKDYKEELSDYRTNLVMHRNEVLGYENRWELTDRGIKVDKPLNVMRIFFRGVDRGNTATVQVSPRREPEFQAGYAGNPVIPLFPPIDLTFFIGTIMSLLAIAFSYDAISGEKEQGTLRLLLSYSVPRDILLLAKWIGGYLALIVPFLLAILCGLIIVLAFPEVYLTAVNWGELGLILAVALLYISGMYSLGILVSTRTSMASTSITVLLLLWVVLVLGIPNIAPYIASQLSPAPSIQSVEKEKQFVEQGERRRFQKEFRAWIDNNPEARQRGGCWMGGICHGMQREGSLRAATAQEKISDHFRKNMGEQVDLTKILSRVSPLSSVVYAIGDLSGTGMKERNRFLKALNRYQGTFITYAFNKGIELAEGEVENLDTSDYPKFIYKESKLGDRIRGVFSDFLTLVIWNIVFFMAAYLSFLRYDVR